MVPFEATHKNWMMKKKRNDFSERTRHSSFYHVRLMTKCDIHCDHTVNVFCRFLSLPVSHTRVHPFSYHFNFLFISFRRSHREWKLKEEGKSWWKVKKAIRSLEKKKTFTGEYLCVEWIFLMKEGKRGRKQVKFFFQETNKFPNIQRSTRTTASWG